MAIPNKPTLSDVYLAEIESDIRSGRPVVVPARNSGETGQAAYEAAVADLTLGLEKLADLGFDFRHLMPASKDLVEMLREGEVIKSTDLDGRDFTNRVVDVDRRQDGLYVILSAGSGRKISETFGQPFVEYVAERVRELDPILLFARRLDRLSRNALALSPLLLPIQARHGYIGDSRRGIRKLEGVESTFVFFETQMAEEEANKLPVQTRDGMVSKTGKSFVEGWVNWSIAGVPPPGFGRARLKGSDGRRGRPIVYLETDECRPSLDETAEGGSTVRDENGNLVDQVANVRFALSRLGKPGWTRKEVGGELIRRHFSTDGVRRLNGAGGEFCDPKVAVRAILDNLETYRTGVIKMPLGVEGFDDLEITGAMPLDGPWAREDDFERIHRWQQKNAERAARRKSMNITGIEATFNGQLVRLRGDFRSAEPKIRFNRTGLGRPDAEKVPDGSVPLPYRIFIESVVEAIQRLGGRANPVLPVFDGKSEKLAELTREQTAVEEAIASAERKRDGLYSRLTETDDRGVSALRGALFNRVQDEYNETADELDELEARRTILKQQHDSMTKATARDDLTPLMQVVARLGDPADTSISSFLEDVVEALEFVSTRTSHDGRQTKTVRWEGVLKLGAGDAEIAAPFRGEWVWKATWGGRNYDPAQIIKSMRAGIPFNSQGVPHKVQAKADVAEKLGIPTRSAMILNCEDPRILRIAMDTVYSQQPPKELDSLAARIKEIYTAERQTTQWRITARRRGLLNEALAKAGDNGGLLLFDELEGRSVESIRQAVRAEPWNQDWEIVDYGIRLKPCDTCSTLLRAQAEIREPVASICLHCRTDRAGIHWPEDPYDLYLADRATRGTAATAGRRAARDRSKQGRLTEAEEQQLVIDYRNLRLPVSELLRRFNISAGTLYLILDKQKEPRRMANRGTYWTEH